MLILAVIHWQFCIFWSVESYAGVQNVSVTRYKYILRISLAPKCTTGSGHDYQCREKLDLLQVSLLGSQVEIN